MECQIDRKGEREICTLYIIINIILTLLIKWLILLKDMLQVPIRNTLGWTGCRRIRVLSPEDEEMDKKIMDWDMI